MSDENLNQLTADDIKWLEYFVYPAWADQLTNVSLKVMFRLRKFGLLYLEQKVVHRHGGVTKTRHCYLLTQDGKDVLNAYRNLKGEG